MADILKNFDKVKTQFKIILFQTKQNKEKSKKNNSKSLDSEDTMSRSKTDRISAASTLKSLDP